MLEVINISEELQKRLEKYLQSEEFELDTAELALGYKAQVVRYRRQSSSGRRPPPSLGSG